MSLQIERALREGFERTISRNGLLFVGVFVAFGLLEAALGLSAGGELFSMSMDGGLQLPPGFEGDGPPMTGPGQFGPSPTDTGLLPWPLALGASVVTAIVAEALRIVAIRVFASEHTDGVPSTLVRRNLAMAVLNGILAGIIVTVLVGLGLILLIVPGIFLALSFFFVRQEVALEDETFVDALGSSWSLTDGHRIELFLLAAIIVVINFLAGLPGAVFVLASPILGTVVGQIIGGFTTVFGVATATRAYVQLREARDVVDAEY